MSRETGLRQKKTSEHSCSEVCTLVLLIPHGIHRFRPTGGISLHQAGLLTHGSSYSPNLPVLLEQDSGVTGFRPRLQRRDRPRITRGSLLSLGHLAVPSICRAHSIASGTGCQQDCYPRWLSMMVTKIRKNQSVIPANITTLFPRRRESSVNADLSVLSTRDRLALSTLSSRLFPVSWVTPTYSVQTVRVRVYR